MALDVTEIAPSLAVAKDRCPVFQSVEDSPALLQATQANDVDSAECKMTF